MTSCGLNGKPLRPEGVYPAAIACVLTDGHMPHVGNGGAPGRHPMITHGEGEQHITGIRNHTVIGFRYFAFTGSVKLILRVRGNGRGHFLISDGQKTHRTSVQVTGSEKWMKYETVVNTDRTAPLYLEYKGTGMMELQQIELKRVVSDKEEENHENI